MSWLVTTWIGLVAVIFAGTGIRDPVTMISGSAGFGSSCAQADCANPRAQRLPATGAKKLAKLRGPRRRSRNAHVICSSVNCFVFKVLISHRGLLRLL